MFASLSSEGFTNDFINTDACRLTIVILQVADLLDGIRSHVAGEDSKT